MEKNISGISFPESVLRVISRLTGEGYDSYAVGGCIRDSILRRTPHDWDITTAAEPSEVVRVFADGDIHVIGTAGIRHGTVMVKAAGDVIEITTFRSDGNYSDHRRPESVTFSHTVEEDLARRDFTMNAIATKPSGDGVCIVDPFGGAADINAGVIRTVGDPAQRFTEDALRILRAVRFSAELGFSVDRKTAEAAIRLRDTLEYVSAERITAELWRTLCADDAGRAVNAFREIFEWITPNGFPERFLKYTDKTKDPYVRLALMLEHGSDGSDFFRRMRFSRKVSSLVLRLLAIDKPPRSREDVCKLMRAFGIDISSCTEYFRILELDGALRGGMSCGEITGEISNILRDEIPYTLQMLAVRGGDVVASGVRPYSVGDVLEYLLSAVQIGNILNRKECLLAAIPDEYKTK